MMPDFEWCMTHDKHSRDCLMLHDRIVVPGATGDPSTCQHAWDGDPWNPQCLNDCGAEWEGP